MAMSTFQKVTLLTCLVLCVSLLLPKLLLSRGRKDAAERPDGNFPPMLHRQGNPEARGQRAASAGHSRSHNSDASAKGKGTGMGAGTGGKSNLAGQIIPVYGFGILLYILYILFKITSKGNNKPTESRFASVRSENVKRKITDFELTQLQEKLRETELVMENIVSSAHHRPDRVKGVTPDQEESLLQQLTEITRVMREGQLVEGMSSENKAQNDWEDFGEESYQYWEHSRCCCHRCPQKETEAEAAAADLLETTPAEDVTGGGDEAEAEEAARECVSTAGREENVCDSGATEMELQEQEEEEEEEEESAGKIDLNVPEEELAGVLGELELTLRMTTRMEKEKMEDLSRPVGAEPDNGQVRRRNRRKRAKKASH